MLSFKFDKTKAVFLWLVGGCLPIVEEEDITILARVKDLLHLHTLSTFDFALHWIGYLEEEFALEDIGCGVFILAPKPNNCDILESLLFTGIRLVFGDFGSISIKILDKFGILIVCDANRFIDSFF